MPNNTICTRMNYFPMIAFHIGCIIYISSLQEPSLKVIEVQFNCLLVYFIVTFFLYKGNILKLNIIKTLYVSRISSYMPLALFLFKLGTNWFRKRLSSFTSLTCTKLPFPAADKTKL